MYDFSTGVSYDLIEVREAIIYYWKENKGLNLDDKRWDVYPLGFAADNSDWVIVNAVAYTGGTPVNLGTWKVSSKGEQSRLITFTNSEVQVSMNGYKLVKDGIVPSAITEKEQKELEKIEKAKVKQKKKEDKEEVKALEKSYKAKIKEMDAEFKESQKDYNLRRKIQGSTSGDEVLIKYKEIKAEQEAKKQQQLEKQREKELKQLERQKQKEEKKQQKELEKSNN